MLQTGDGVPVRAAEGKRRAILEAVLEVIADTGLQSVTHRRVAATAGVPLGSTTYYFRTRDDLIRAAFQHSLAGTDRLVSRLGHDRPAETVEQLALFMAELAMREFEIPGRVRVEYELILAASRDPLLAVTLHAAERVWIAGLAESLEALSVPRPLQVARAILHLFRGFEVERLTLPSADPAGLARRIIDLVSSARRDPAQGA